MIKTMGLAKRKEGMSVEEFQRYWREVHGPIVARTPGLRRYVQSQTLPELYEGDSSPAFDGLAELWYDSLEARAEAQATPEWRAATADGPNFIGSTTGLLAVEVPIVDAFPSPRDRQSMIKHVGFLTRKDGMSVEAFQRYWRDVHAPLVVAALTGMRHYVQCHLLPQMYDGENVPFCDGIVEAWFDSLEAYPLGAIRGPRDGRPQTPATADLENFAKPSTTPAIVTREVVILEQTGATVR
jgi:uncharacterized protein (TIGR02118 family)